jgi:hypothetical protein
MHSCNTASQVSVSSLPNAILNARGTVALDTEHSPIGPLILSQILTTIFQHTQVQT